MNTAGNTVNEIAPASGALPQPDEACVWSPLLGGSGRVGETVTGKPGPVYETA